jgi:hypothetical protein
MGFRRTSEFILDEGALVQHWGGRLPGGLFTGELNRLFPASFFL